MWSVNVMFLLLLCYACLSTGNGDVYFVSKNFFNVLHWDSVTGFPGQDFYSVQYSRDYEDQYRIKEECQNITRLFCDLTEETPSKWDVRYRAKVTVNGTLLGVTTSLYPFTDTVLGAPNLSTHTTASSLHVKVTLPEGPGGVSLQEIINSSKNRGSKIEYILKIPLPECPVQGIKNETGQFDISLKHSQRSHCGSVVYKPTPVMGRSDSEEAFFCFKMLDENDDPRVPLQWPLVSIAVVASIVIISVVWTCNYLKSGMLKSTPKALIITSSARKVLQYPDKNRIMSQLLVETKGDQTDCTSVQAKAKVGPPTFENYSPQDIPWHICRCNTDSSLSTDILSTTSNLGGTSVHSSVIYSAVAVHVQVEDESQQAATEAGVTSRSPLSTSEEINWDKGEKIPKLISSKAPQLPIFDASEDDRATQLVLNTVHNIDGQLVLSPFPLLLESGTGDAVSQMNPVKKPQLSDLFVCQDGLLLTSLQSSDSSDWTDSGCDDSAVNTPTNSYYNTSYPPPQTVAADLHEGCHTTQSSDATCESGYKKNWMPKSQYRLASTDTCTTISSLMDEDMEDNVGEEGVENLGQIFLGSWEIQIQK